MQLTTQGLSRGAAQRCIGQIVCQLTAQRRIKARSSIENDKLGAGPERTATPGRHAQPEIQTHSVDLAPRVAVSRAMSQPQALTDEKTRLNPSANKAETRKQILSD